MSWPVICFRLVFAMIDSRVVLRATRVPKRPAATAKSLLEVAVAMVRFNPKGHSQPDRF
jgi:hypothetical protein